MTECATLGMYHYESLDPVSIRQKLDELAMSFAEVTSSAQGENFSQERILRMRERLKRSDYAIIASTDGGTVIGYGVYGRLSLDGGGLILYEDGKMINHEHQGRGVGTYITDLAVKTLSHDYFVMRTQNPAEIISVKRILPQLSVYRPDIPLHETIVKAVAGRNGEMEETDFHRGVFRPKQRRGRIGDYSVIKSDSRVQEFEQVFAIRNLDRDYGERLYFIADNKLRPDSDW